MARQGDRTRGSGGIGEVESEDLKPIRVVERELTRPDGTTVRVKVPVYPPFRLKQHTADKPPPRQAPAARPRRKQSTG